MDKLMYKTSEAMKILNISRNLIYKMMDEGKLRYINIGNVRRIRREELERVMAEGTE